MIKAKTKIRDCSVCELYKSGVGVIDIAKKFKVTRSLIWQILKYNKIKLRSQKGIHFKYHQNDFFFSKLNELSCFWAGFIAADGCIREKANTTSMLQIELAIKDLDFLKQFINDIKWSGDIRIKKPRVCHFQNQKPSISHMCSVAISSDQICNDLKNNFNITPKKSLKYIPPVLQDTFMRHFIRGYFAGDGTICYSDLIRKSMKIYRKFRFQLVGTKKAMIIFRNYLARKCNLNKTKIHMDYHGNLFRSVYSCGKALKIMKFLHNRANRVMDRKTIEHYI
jgi:hypothetical protein